MELQLNEILTSLQIITTRIHASDLKMDGFNERLNAVKVKFSNRYDELEKNFTKSKNEMDDMKVNYRRFNKIQRSARTNRPSKRIL